MMILIILTAIVALVASHPVVENQQKTAAKLPSPTIVVTPIEVVDAGPVVARKVRQFFDNTNFNEFSQSENVAGPGGFENIRDMGVDFSQQIGFGGGGFNNGGIGGGFGGGFGGF